MFKKKEDVVSEWAMPQDTKIVDVMKGIDKPSDSAIWVKTLDDLKRLNEGEIIYHLIEHRCYKLKVKNQIFACAEQQQYGGY